MKGAEQLNTYPVMEHFYTIQGEGVFTGVPAYFIRLAGCDVGCVWCDVPESWKTEGYPVLSVEELITAVKQTPAKIAVITGGEPAMYELSSLTLALKNIGIRTHIETSGAYEISGIWDWICLSPKKFKKPVESSFAKANELKVVIFNKHDFLWAEQHAQKVLDRCTLILSPEWSKRELIMPLLVEYVKQHTQWKIGLQIHKYLQVP